MKYEKVLKFLEIIGSIFIIISLMEIVYLLLLNFTPFILDGNTILLSEFVYSSTIWPFSGTLLWLFVIISVVSYSILGIFVFKVSSKKDIESRPLAKLNIIIGMVSLLGAIVKMDFLVLLGKTNIATTFTTISFQWALFSTSITGLMPAIFWIFFISVNCFFLLAGLCITAVGIKWSILQEEAPKEVQEEE
ncbi:MAG: hypothetical protein ACFE9C_03210 [Candidatus Hodarchaeota archaeon]